MEKQQNTLVELSLDECEQVAGGKGATSLHTVETPSGRINDSSHHEVSTGSQSGGAGAGKV